jgi:lactosylceramide 4-alpha-galactosyltransferase
MQLPYSFLCFQASELSTRRCKGFQILSNKEFFPIPYQSWKLFFDESRSNETMDIIKESFGVHVWNKLSKFTKVRLGSRQPYSLLAERACPRVYSVCGPDF